MIEIISGEKFSENDKEFPCFYYETKGDPKYELGEEVQLIAIVKSIVQRQEDDSTYVEYKFEVRDAKGGAEDDMREDEDEDGGIEESTKKAMKHLFEKEEKTSKKESY